MKKFSSISFLTLISCTVIQSVPIQPVSAVCVATDISVQMAIRGSRIPAQQSNNVGIQRPENCWGNTTTNTAIQLYQGSGTVQQNRNSFHSFGDSNPAPFGVKFPMIQNQIYVPIDVYSPTHDPTFLGNFPSRY